MTNKTLLIIDDDVDICTLLERFFKRKGYNVKSAFTGQNGLQIVKKGGVDLVLTDFRLPDMEGFAIIRAISELKESIPVIVITGYSEVNQAVKAIQLGAYEYVTKPIYPEEILTIVGKALKQNQTSKVVTKIKEDDAPHSTIDFVNPFEAFLITNSHYSQQLQKQISLVAPTNMTVIIIGETGTGKEVVARMLHKSSKRRNRPFIPVDCGALTQELAASELFGHVKGAFTGATSDKKGSFELANNGTLFLDEIGNLSYENQMKLLRVLQERTIRRVGSEKETPVNVRIIAATNEDLHKAVINNKFREDVYYRINEFKINLSPLRDNREELEEFVLYFLEKSNQSLHKNVTKIATDVMDLFYRYPWNGNIRELKNVMKQSVLMTENDTLEMKCLPIELTNFNWFPTTSSTNTSLELKVIVEDAEKKAIVAALTKSKNNKTKTAVLLGVDRKTLYNKLNAYGINEV